MGLVGTSDHVAVNGWYYDDSYKIDTIEAGGLVVTESQVALMV